MVRLKTRLRLSKLRKPSNKPNARAPCTLPSPLPSPRKGSPSFTQDTMLQAEPARAAGFCLHTSFNSISTKCLVQILWASHPRIRGVVFTGH